MDGKPVSRGKERDDADGRGRQTRKMQKGTGIGFLSFGANALFADFTRLAGFPASNETADRVAWGRSFPLRSAALPEAS